MVKAVAKKVAPKKAKVVKEKVEELVVDWPTTGEVLAFELSNIVGNNVMKSEVYGIMAKVGSYDTEKLNYHLDRIDSVIVSKQELMAIWASLFR